MPRFPFHGTCILSTHIVAHTMDNLNLARAILTKYAKEKLFVDNTFFLSLFPTSNATHMNKHFEFKP